MFTNSYPLFTIPLPRGGIFIQTSVPHHLPRLVFRSVSHAVSQCFCGPIASARYLLAANQILFSHAYIFPAITHTLKPPLVRAESAQGCQLSKSLSGRIIKMPVFIHNQILMPPPSLCVETGKSVARSTYGNPDAQIQDGGVKFRLIFIQLLFHAVSTRARFLNRRPHPRRFSAQRQEFIFSILTVPSR